MSVAADLDRRWPVGTFPSACGREAIPDQGGEAMTVECPVCGEAFEREEDLVRHQGEDHVGVDLPDEEQAVP